MASTHQLEERADLTVLNYLRSGRLLVALVLGFGVLIVAAMLASRAAPLRSNEAAGLHGAELSPPRPLPALTLTRTDGSLWSSAETEGQLSLFFFGYTSCPDVCPLTLSRARQVRAELGEDADEVAVYFITVDPERDSPGRLGDYVSQFDPAFVGLTGASAQLEAARQAFGVVAVRQPNASGSGYAVDHTATSFLVDREGRIRLIYPHDAPSVDIVADLRTLLVTE